MVLFSFGRMLLRRMALRKGVALSVAGLFLLGVCGVIYMLQEEGAAGGGRTRTIVVVSAFVWHVWSVYAGTGKFTA